ADEHPLAGTCKIDSAREDIGRNDARELGRLFVQRRRRETVANAKESKLLVEIVLGEVRRPRVVRQKERGRGQRHAIRANTHFELECGGQIAAPFAINGGGSGEYMSIDSGDKLPLHALCLSGVQVDRERRGRAGRTPYVQARSRSA